MTDTAPRPSATTLHSSDTMGIGQTSGQRSAEIIAGIRAELRPTPEALALSKLGGRVIARVLMSIEKPKAFNYIPNRMEVFTALALRHVDPAAPFTHVEIASGFSPRCVHLGIRYPHATFIEVDQPEVVREKQRRLRLHERDVKVPANLTWRAADLGVTSLSDVLENQLVDVVVAEGLMPYFKLEDVTRIAEHVRKSLKPGGAFMSSILYRPALEAGREVVRYYQRFIGALPGVVNDEQQAKKLFLDAGYASAEAYRVSGMAAEMKLPETPLDGELIIVARRAYLGNRLQLPHR